MRLKQYAGECRSGIGGSDIAAVFGLSPWKSRYALYLEKTAVPESVKTPEPTGGSAALYWANQQKRLIAKAYIRKTGCLLKKSTKITRDSNRRFFHGHLDFFLTGTASEPEKALECVSAFLPNDQWGPDGGCRIPPYYAMKVQWYMGLCPNLSSMDVAVLFGGRDFRIYRIRRDNELIAHLRRHAEIFWQEHVEKRLPPAPLTEEEVREIYPNPVRKTVQATKDMEEMLRHYRRICDVQEQAEKVRRILRDGILCGMGDSAVLTDSKGEPLATFKTNSAGTRMFRLSARGEK